MTAAIDTSNARENMAFVGDRKEIWHGLGNELTYGESIETWTREAGLEFDVLKAPVSFLDEAGVPHRMGGRNVLFRNDTKAPLGIASDGYRVVQPKDVMEFFRDLTEEGGFQLDTAGSLHGGKRVWALAKMNEGTDIIGTDRVLPYLLLATSFDGGLATTAQFTAVRVVCQNTLSIALTSGAAAKRVSVAHHSTFDALDVKKRLGLARSAWDEFVASARKMAQLEVTSNWLDKVTSELIAPTLGPKADGERQDADGVRNSKAYKAIVDLFSGKAIGSDLTAGPSAWQWLNSVTEYVDHHRGRSADTRVNSAWFGNGDTIKSRALELAEQL